MKQCKALGFDQKNNRDEKLSKIRKEGAQKAIDYFSFIPGIKLSEDKESITFGDFSAEVYGYGDELWLRKDGKLVGRVKSKEDLGEILIRLSKKG